MSDDGFVPTRLPTIIALIAYLGTLIVVGIYTRRKTQAFGDFITGGGAIPAWMLAVSFMANFVSSNSFVGHSAKSYQVGLVWCWVGAIMVACCAISWSIFAPRFAAFARDSGAETLPDFFVIRFSSPSLGVLVNWIAVFATIFYVLAVMRGTALVLASGLAIPYEAGLLVLYGVVLAYCILGGLWADVSTDVVQTVFLVAGAVALFVGALVAVPTEPVAAPPIHAVPMGLVLAVGLGGGLKLLADPKQVMVFYGLRDARSAHRLRWFGPALLLVVYACLFPLGFLVRRLIAHTGDLEELIPTLIFRHQMLGTGFATLFLASLLAASMSSLDSALLVMATCIEKHAVARWLKRKPSIGRARVVLFGVATLALLLSLRPLGSIIALTTFAGALLGAGLLPAICVGLSNRKISSSWIAASVAAGVLGATLGKLAPRFGAVSSPWVQDVFMGLLGSMLVLLLALVRAARSGARSPSA